MDKTLRITDFMGLERPAVYADSHDFALSPLDGYDELCEGMSVNGLLLLFCIDGRLSITINGKHFTIDPGTCILCRPNTALSEIQQLDNGRTTVVGYSMEILSRMLTGGERVYKVLNAFTQNPFITNDQRYLMSRIDVLLNILRYRKSSNDIYHDELMYHIFAALLFDVINDLHIPDGSKREDNGSHTRTEHIYKQFLTMLTREDGHNRAVSYFADKLFITPKYLSRITKFYAGRPALDIILEHAVDRLKIELQYTDRQMKDIADDFGFESYSTFCKFIKKYTGMTPQQCRNKVKME